MCECRYAFPSRNPTIAIANPTIRSPSNAPSTCPPVCLATTNVTYGSVSNSLSPHTSRSISTHRRYSSTVSHFRISIPTLILSLRLFRGFMFNGGCPRHGVCAWVLGSSSLLFSSLRTLCPLRSLCNLLFTLPHPSLSFRPERPDLFFCAALRRVGPRSGGIVAGSIPLCSLCGPLLTLW